MKRLSSKKSSRLDSLILFYPHFRSVNRRFDSAWAVVEILLPRYQGNLPRALHLRQIVTEDAARWLSWRTSLESGVERDRREIRSRRLIDVKRWPTLHEACLGIASVMISTPPNPYMLPRCESDENRVRTRESRVWDRAETLIPLSWPRFGTARTPRRKIRRCPTCLFQLRWQRRAMDQGEVQGIPITEPLDVTPSKWVVQRHQKSSVFRKNDAIHLRLRRYRISGRNSDRQRVLLTPALSTHNKWTLRHSRSPCRQ